MNKQNHYCYDIEVFPNFFSATFYNLADNKAFVFVIGEKRNNIKKLVRFLDAEIVLIGYNNILYDGAILHYITSTYNSDSRPATIQEFNLDLFNLSGRIITSTDRMNFDSFIRNHQYPQDVKYKQIDLMKMQAFDKLGVSLKQIAINLGWHKIQDLPLPYDHIVQPEEYGLILDYNMNDVLITKKLYESLVEQLELRENLSVSYGVDLMSASDSKMANVILEDMYCKMMGVTPNEIRNLRTHHNTIKLADCLGANIEFKTNSLNRIKREIEEKVLSKDDNFKYSKTIKFAGIEYELGVGGLHSVDNPAIFKADENTSIKDFDVSSYYPSIMIVNNLYPEHLNAKFVDILRKITVDRLTAKKLNDKIKGGALKITVNSIFGKLGSDTFWLYDIKKLLSVTVSGQLYLLMLIESLVLAGIEVISANTDGVVTRISKNLEDKAIEILDWWQKKTGFALETTEYSAYFRSDVNNYITLKPDGSTKEKGRYLMKVDLKKGYRHPIVPKALYKYFINGTPIIETLKNCNNILEFCISQKVGGEFILEYREENKTTKLQKNNRFFISNTGGALVKKHNIKGTEIGLYVGELTTVLNDYDPNKPISEYDINYSFYEEEAKKYIEEVEKNMNPSSSLFEDELENYVSEEYEQQLKHENLSKEFKGMKGLPSKIIDNLLFIEENFQGEDFLDFLVYCEEKSLLSSKFKDLIKVNYFKKYGKNKKLLCIFEEFTKGKNKYTKTLSDKTKRARYKELQSMCIFAEDEEFSIREQIQNEISILGRIKTVFDVDKNYVFVDSVETKYTPKIKLYNISKGGLVEVKISKRTYENYPIKTGDIVLCKSFKKKQSVKRDENNNWIPIPDKFEWWLETYYVTKENDIIS